MQQHALCMELVQRDPFAKATYLHWNLVLTPFAPFFVIFSYVIETSSTKDLRLLQEFSTGLETSVDSSETVEKLWRLWHIMSGVATLYVKAKSQQQEDEAMVPIGNQFDVYLNQLGFLPMGQTNMDPVEAPNAEVTESSQVAHIANWMSGSRNMMGLLEQDLSQIGGLEWRQE
ncbi:hypothetical protein ACJ41O_006544 [Fusarium nematophilum]